MTTLPFPVDELLARATLLVYRAASYIVLNLLDDAAILAMMFC